MKTNSTTPTKVQGKNQGMIPIKFTLRNQAVYWDSSKSIGGELRVPVGLGVLLLTKKNLYQSRYNRFMVATQLKPLSPRLPWPIYSSILPRPQVIEAELYTTDD